MDILCLRIYITTTHELYLHTRILQYFIFLFHLIYKKNRNSRYIRVKQQNILICLMSPIRNEVTSCLKTKLKDCEDTRHHSIQDQFLSSTKERERERDKRIGTRVGCYTSFMLILASHNVFYFILQYYSNVFFPSHFFEVNMYQTSMQIFSIFHEYQSHTTRWGCQKKCDMPLIQAYFLSYSRNLFQFL